jgi:uncharacterized membrane protein YfcA
MNMKSIWMICALALAFVAGSHQETLAVQATIAQTEITAGDPVTVNGVIDPGSELYVVICSDSQFRPPDAMGLEEKKKLVKSFGETAIPPTYYVATSAPDSLAEPMIVSKGQTSGLFAFPPFQYELRVNKIKSWETIAGEVKKNLGPVATGEQWRFLTYTHEDKFGINTISKEIPISGGNARMVLTDHGLQPEPWNKGVSLSLDKKTGAFSLSMAPYRNLAPGTKLEVYVNGEKAGLFTIKGAGYFFATANTYMNPLVVVLGAFVIGVLFVIMGAAGGLFTAAFQITVLGTNGPLGINAANTVKPTNLFLTLCSPVTGLLHYFQERRFAWPLALFFAAGIVLGAFWLGPEYSAKYLSMKAYKFYLGIVCLVIGIKLFIESLPSSIAKKKAMKAIIQKFNQAVKDAKEKGTAMEMGRVEFDHFHPVSFKMQFWGETFLAKPLLMLVSGILMGMIASSFGVGGGFMFMPFMTSLMGYPMYLAVPIALAGTFATSVGGITKYFLMGYSPDWVMAICIAAGAIGGGVVGPKIQKRLPEVFLKRLLALALVLVFLNYTGAVPFLR